MTDQAFFLMFGSLHAGLGRLALLPLVVLASRICPKVSTLGCSDLCGQYARICHVGELMTGACYRPSEMLCKCCHACLSQQFCGRPASSAVLWLGPALRLCVKFTDPQKMRREWRPQCLACS